MPTMGNPADAELAGGAGAFGAAALRGWVGRREGEGFFFMRLFLALNRGSFGSR